MKIFIKKKGAATIVQIVQLALNGVAETKWSCYQAETKKPAIGFFSPGNSGTTFENVVNRVFNIKTYEKVGISKAMAAFILANVAEFEDIESHWVYEFPTEKSLGFATFRGEPFGSPKQQLKGIEGLYLEPKYVPDVAEYYSESSGNQFRSTTKIHPTEKWESETLIDATGNEYYTVYKSPGHIDGWGSGFKGGFYVKKLES